MNAFKGGIPIYIKLCAMMNQISDGKKASWSYPEIVLHGSVINFATCSYRIITWMKKTIW